MLYSKIRYSHFLAKELDELRKQLDSLNASELSRKPEKKDILRRKIQECRSEYRAVCDDINNWKMAAPLCPNDKEYLDDYIHGKSTRTIRYNFPRDIKKLTHES